MYCIAIPPCVRFNIMGTNALVLILAVANQLYTAVEVGEIELNKHSGVQLVKMKFQRA